MELKDVIKKKSLDSKIEAAICESLSGAKSEADIYNMSSDFITNAIDMSKRKPDETSVALNELFQQKKESFEDVITFSYYISALQFWSYLAKQGNPEGDLLEVVENVDKESERCKNVLFYYLVKVFEPEVFEKQMDTFRKNFNVSDVFHDSLRQYLGQYQLQIIQQLLEKLAG